MRRVLSRLCRSVGGILFTGLLGAVAGCGPSYGEVHGTVTHHGKPVVWGNVVMIGSDHMPYYGAIHQDGTYVIKKVPVGEVKIGVNSGNPDIEPKLKPEEKAAREELRNKAGLEALPKPPKGAWFPIPAKYNDPLKSGLTGEVNAPTTTIDVKLD